MIVNYVTHNKILIHFWISLCHNNWLYSTQSRKSYKSYRPIDDRHTAELNWKFGFDFYKIKVNRWNIICGRKERNVTRNNAHFFRWIFWLFSNFYQNLPVQRNSYDCFCWFSTMIIHINDDMLWILFKYFLVSIVLSSGMEFCDWSLWFLTNLSKSLNWCMLYFTPNSYCSYEFYEWFVLVKTKQKIIIWISPNHMKILWLLFVMRCTGFQPWFVQFHLY